MSLQSKGKLLDGEKPATPEALFQMLSELELHHETIRHPAVFTVAEAQADRFGTTGGFTKNLFLRSKKGRMWLVVCDENRRLDLKAVARNLETGRLSFGSPGRLMQYLGVAPGAVTPFAAINDRQGCVQLVMDRSLLQLSELNFHPLDNTMTTRIATRDLLRFLEHANHAPQFIDLE